MCHLQNRRDARGHDHRHSQRDKSVVVIRDVPAEICDDCGEYYLSKPTSSRVYADADADAEATAKQRVEVEIQRYAA